MCADLIFIGFTGSRTGMSTAQKNTTLSLLKILSGGFKVVVRHGDCIGSDSDFDDIAGKLRYRIAIHPPKNPKARAFCYFRKKDNAERVQFSEENYLKRNMNIVEGSNLLIATPVDFTYTLRSGTWHTIRHATLLHRPVYAISKTGEVAYFSNFVDYNFSSKEGITPPPKVRDITKLTNLINAWNK